MEYKCECGGKIIFQKKKTFAIPDLKYGVCPQCKCQYVLENEKLSKKGGAENASETKNSRTVAEIGG